MSDAFDQGLRAADYRRGSPSVDFALEIPAGPKSLKAGVSLAYEGQYPLAFRSHAVWPDGDNYEAAVRAAMLGVLLKDGVPLFGGVFTLRSIKWDPVHSCEVAFALAASEATRSLVSLITRHDEKG